MAGKADHHIDLFSLGHLLRSGSRPGDSRRGRGSRRRRRGARGRRWRARSCGGGGRRRGRRSSWRRSARCLSSSSGCRAGACGCCGCRRRAGGCCAGSCGSESRGARRIRQRRVRRDLQKLRLRPRRSAPAKLVLGGFHFCFANLRRFVAPFLADITRDRRDLLRRELRLPGRHHGSRGEGLSADLDGSLKSFEEDANQALF